MGDELWDENGYWQGPRDLGFFLRVNALFAGFWWLVLTAMLSVAISEETAFHGWYAVALGIPAGSAATLLFMFLFSRGWIAEGD